jgi:hypothetical protein
MDLFGQHCLTRQQFLCLFTALIIGWVTVSEVEAQTYRYTGNMPAAKMTLDMMEVMGYIQRVPDSQYGGGMQNSPMASMWSPFGGMGTMPMSAGMMAMQNPVAGGMSSWPGANMMSPPQPGSANNYPNSPQPANGSIQVNPADLAALLRAVQQGGRPGAPAYPPVETPQSEINPAVKPQRDDSGESVSSKSTNASPTAPQKVNLSGVWLGSNKEALVVIGRQFIWTDQSGRSIEGEIAVQGDRLLTRLASNGTVMAYRFKQDGDRFTAMNEAGHQYFFQRKK